MEEKKLTEQESLALIAGMIQKTKQRTGLDSGTPLLLWGYTTAITAVLVHATLILTQSHKSMLLWLLIPLIGWIWIIVLLCRDSQPGTNEWGPNPKEV